MVTVRVKRRRSSHLKLSASITLGLFAVLIVLIWVCCYFVAFHNLQQESSIKVETHHHAIPNVLIFTHSRDLIRLRAGLGYWMLHFFLLLHKSGSYVLPYKWARSMLTQSEQEKRLFLLRDNVKRTAQMYADAKITFLTDADCLEEINSYYGEDDGNFMTIKYMREQGKIKGDICRGLALYRYGGLYMDVDLSCRVSVWPLIHLNTSFVTIREYASDDFFQAFIAVTKHHPIIKRYLDLFLIYYNGELNEQVKDDKGVVLLRVAHDQILLELPELASTVQLWNETLFNRTAFPDVEAPPGTTKVHKEAFAMCQFLVATPEKKVPFWSHVPGSSDFCQIEKVRNTETPHR